MGKEKEVLGMPQLHFICGKGGVGKSTYACALAKKLTQTKMRTLLVQVNASDSHSAILKTAPINSNLEQVEPLLWVLNVTPKESLREYLLLKVPSKYLYKLIFDSPLMRAFFKFVPSLAEMTMLGKIWHHAEEKNEFGQPRYQRIVVDCPATGHGLRFLNVAKTVYAGVKKGGIAKEALQIAQTLADPKRSGLHVVTLPEEMAVNETLQLMKAVHQSKAISLYRVVMNALIKPIFDEAAKEIIEQIVTSPLLSDFDRLLTCGQKRIAQEEAEHFQVSRIQNVVADNINFLQLPLHVGGDENAIMETMLFKLNAFDQAKDF